jgi:CubicO group peptidase (beta-lactamase class C family)
LGVLLEESQKGNLPNNAKVDLDSHAYSFLPDNTKLTDQLKEKITIGHLLSMISGIAGEAKLTFGMPTKIDSGPFEHALGYSKNRYGKKNRCPSR